jgi:hypothetical protein
VPNPGQADADGDGLGNACDAQLPPPPDAEERAECCIDVHPAATLLVPYFEVDLASADGVTTLFAVINVDASPRLVSVTLWTDWAVPSLTFNLYLSGFDVQTVNLRDVLTHGELPETGPAAFPGCPGSTLGGVLSPAERAHLRAWHTGAASPTSGDCAGSPRGGALATGYVTLDVVHRCSDLDPSDPGYFGEGGTGVASNDNVLLGDVFYARPGEDFADGDPAVHVRADAEAFGPGSYTFYGRYVAGTATDDRQPLGSLFGARFLQGGTFDGATVLRVWRDTKSADAAPVACGARPVWAPLPSRPIAVWDEEENLVTLGASSKRLPWATQTLEVGSKHLAVPSLFGWLTLDLGHQATGLFGPTAQGWVIAGHRASGRFTVGHRAFRLASPCGE